MPSFASSDGTFFAMGSGGPVRVVVPATGNTVKMQSSERAVCFNHAADIAALTVLLPTVTPGEKIELLFRQAVTSLTIHDALDDVITGAPSTAVDGALVIMRYVSKAIGWVVWK